MNQSLTYLCLGWLFSTLPGMKNIYLASDIAQAQLIVNMLAQQFIPAHIEHVHQAGGLGELAVTYPQVWVQREQDVARARSLIEAFETANKAPQAEIRCPQCNEPNPKTFDLCWACQADLW